MKKIFFVLLPALLSANLLLASCLPSQGNTLNLYGIDPITLDPAIAGDATSHEYIVQLFSGLVYLDDNLMPTPDIAQRWDISQDGRTYTFYLRHDVKFHNGQTVKARDFKYSWERAAAPATGSLTAPTYLGDIVGVNEMLAGQTKEISGVKVIDDYTLQVTIDAPKSYFLAKLTYPTTFVIDSANVKSGSQWWSRPNGTGPFRLKQWTGTNQLVLERNSLYYGKLADVGLVVFQLYGGIPMNLYETGKIDITGVSSIYIDQVTDKTGPFYQELTIAPELSFRYIGFNMTKPPFDDVKIRRAFSQAIDKDKLVSLVFRDMMQRADGILPPGMPGYNTGLSGLSFDIDQAKQLIKESKYGDIKNLPPVTITTAGRGGSISRDLEAIIYQWQENLGVTVKVRQLEPERFIYNLKEEKDEMFDLGWVADYPHPQSFLDILFRSGVQNNYGEYSNAEVDTLLGKARTEPDIKLSLALYRQVEQKLVEDAAILPLWFGKNFILVKPYVAGYKLNPLGYARLNLVSIVPH
ncbi:MAG: peptide ABC transporter substrate-binding protein [Dehalococcoidales bacterium]|nr:peptide ABC transporter substrate-binding protein [Dehalococcoidales bacterium]MDP6737659.1 peptide ABC transporter substrate-binding protein [Dehalococcoidales bacterium]